MPAIILRIILTFSILCGPRVVSGLNGPRNVRVTSYNMDMVLEWDPPENANNVVYKTEYNTSVSDYRDGCVNTTELRCNFTSQVVFLTVFGKYTCRVRAEQGGERSAWVESSSIVMDKHSTIGPPSVSLVPIGANMDVSITDPVFRISNLRGVYNQATYNITYWKKGQEEKAKSMSGVQQNRVVLSKLEPWTKYCVQVQINTEMNANPSQLSNVTCESTTIEEETPWMAAVVTFVVMAMVMSLVAVAVVYRKAISHLLCPKDSLPQHLKEYLLGHPQSSISLAIQKSQPPEEIYHPVSIVAEGNKEEELPLEAGATNCNS
ncbi:cytokine receptor family member b4 [Polymixia lowei]